MTEKIREPRYVDRLEADAAEVGDVVTLIASMDEESAFPTLCVSVSRAIVEGVPDPVWLLATPWQEVPVMALINLDPILAYMNSAEETELRVRYLLTPGEPSE